MRALGLAGLALSAVSAAVLVLLRSSGWGPGSAGFSLVWALPICFGLHVFEEFALPGGFKKWSARVRPQNASAMTDAHLWRVNVIGGLAALGVTLGALDYAGGYSWAGIRVWLVLVFTLAVNAVSHVSGSIAGRSYGPGLVTSVVLYLPLTLLSTGYLLSSGAVDVATGVALIAVACRPICFSSVDFGDSPSVSGPPNKRFDPTPQAHYADAGSA